MLEASNRKLAPSKVGKTIRKLALLKFHPFKRNFEGLASFVNSNGKIGFSCFRVKRYFPICSQVWKQETGFCDTFHRENCVCDTRCHHLTCPHPKVSIKWEMRKLRFAVCLEALHRSVIQNLVKHLWWSVLQK